MELSWDDPERLHQIHTRDSFAALWSHPNVIDLIGSYLTYLELMSLARAFSSVMPSLSQRLPSFRRRIADHLSLIGISLDDRAELSQSTLIGSLVLHCLMSPIHQVNYGPIFTSESSIDILADKVLVSVNGNWYGRMIQDILHSSRILIDHHSIRWCDRAILTHLSICSYSLKDGELTVNHPRLLLKRKIPCPVLDTQRYRNLNDLQRYLRVLDRQGFEVVYTDSQKKSIQRYHKFHRQLD